MRVFLFQKKETVIFLTMDRPKKFTMLVAYNNGNGCFAHMQPAYQGCLKICLLHSGLLNMARFEWKILDFERFQ
jgi:hypothetical protein